VRHEIVLSFEQPDRFVPLSPGLIPFFPILLLLGGPIETRIIIALVGTTGVRDLSAEGNTVSVVCPSWLLCSSFSERFSSLFFLP